jgi:hypothetical protein
VRRAPGIIGVAAATVIIASCGGCSGGSGSAGKTPTRPTPASGSAPASASSAAAPPDFAPFARAWAGHDESLVIHANGQFLLTVWNSGDPASSSGNLTSTPGDEAIGEATQATAEPPVPKGERIIISLDAQTDSVSVSAVNFDSETVRNVSFCGPQAPPSYCGA